MNVSFEKSRSFWTDESVLEGVSALLNDERADVVVVGSGIAGMSAAYELASSGRKVVILDRGPIGKGMTARTTAHLASASDDGFDELIRLRGIGNASAWRESQQAAIDRTETLQQKLKIDCDFQRVDGYLFAARKEDAEWLEREYEAAQRVGLPVFKQTGVPLAGHDATPALRYPDQARVHPLKYLHGLARAIVDAGGRFYADATVIEVAEDDDDGMAFIGRDPGSERVFVATGDSGQGITHGALAGLIIKDLILPAPAAGPRPTTPVARRSPRRANI